jgi:hypothetical protein
MLEYPLTQAYPLAELSVRLFWFALLFGILYASIAILVIRKRAWSRTMFATAVVIAVVALSMAPIRSPDLYWTLDAGRAWVQEGTNPYLAGPRISDEGSWSARAGIVMGMVYGPAWTLLVSAAAWTGSLLSALAVMKLVGVLALAGGLLAVWELVKLSGIPPDRRESLMALVVLNPLLLHAGLVDVSNDVITFAAVAWAMVLSARGRHLPAAAVLLLGGLVKYVPWLLMPIPLVLAYRLNKRPSRFDIACLIIAVAVVLEAYVPFGRAALLGGDMRMAYEVFVRADMAFPIAWLLLLLGMPVFWIQITGALMALGVLTFCIVRQRWELAWWAPLVALLLVGGSWVNPWYLLWLLPAAVAAGSAASVATLGVSGILMPWVVKSRAMGFALLAGGLWHYRKTKTAR